MKQSNTYIEHVLEVCRKHSLRAYESRKDKVVVVQLKSGREVKIFSLHDVYKVLGY